MYWGALCTRIGCMKLPEIKKDQTKVSLAGVGALLTSIISFVIVLYVVTILVKLAATFWG